MKPEQKRADYNPGSTDAPDNIYLCNCIFGDRYKKELKEINKHEIIVKIADMMGHSPGELAKAEIIFEKIKYAVANYVIHHEYNSPKGVSADLVEWLDLLTNPDKSKKFRRFVSRFLKA